MELIKSNFFETGVLPISSVLEAYTSPKGLSAIVSRVKFEIENFNYDLSTTKGRAETKTLSSNISKLKVKLDGLGKELVADWKSKSKVVDVSRKTMRDQMDELKILARQPLTDLEAHEAEVLKVQFEEEEKRLLQDEINSAHELAGYMNREFDEKIKHAAWVKEESKKQEAEKAAEQQAAREKDLVEKAIIDAEQRLALSEKTAAQEKEASIQAAKEAKQAEVQAKLDQEAAVVAARKAAETAQNEKKAKELAEAKQREDDAERVATIDKNIIDHLVWNAGLSEFKAKATLTAIKNKGIPNVSISY